MRPILIGAVLLLGAAPLVGAQAPAELRGAWLWGRECTDAQTTDALLDRAETLNLNTLFVLVFAHHGHATYNSAMVPMVEGIEEGFDPLGHLVSEGRRRGIDIHAWFVNGSYSWGQQEGILDERPEWRAMDLNGSRADWYDLCQAEVREWQTRLMCEVVDRYDVAGVHFDYIRFGNRNVCVCPVCIRNAREEADLDLAALSYPTLPASGSFSGNPLGTVTTAKVLAEFDDGVPAITVNRVGEGHVLLLNWHVDKWCPGAISTTIERFLLDGGVAPGGEVFLLDSDLNAERYPRDYWRQRLWLQELGYSVRKTTDTTISELPAGSAVVLFHFYMMNEDIAADLLQHVQAGGRAIFMDGPVFATKYPSARQLLGFSAPARYFNEAKVVRPVDGGGGLVPVSDRSMSVEEEKAKQARWDQWRMEQVTRLVRSVSERARAIRPEIAVTAAVFYDKRGSEGVLQDWPRWHREGLLDYVIPMSYVKTPEKLEESFAWWREIDPELARIIPAVGAWDIEPDAPAAERARAIAEQVAVCRRQNARGACMFVLGRIDDELAALLGPLAFPGQTLPYRPGPPRPRN